MGHLGWLQSMALSGKCLADWGRILKQPTVPHLSQIFLFATVRKSWFLVKIGDSKKINGIITLGPNLTRAGKVPDKVPCFELSLEPFGQGKPLPDTVCSR